MERALVPGSTIPAVNRDEVIGLMAAECRAIHAQCDFLGVPSHAFGERLSISQRVAELVRLLNKEPARAA